MIIKIKNRDIIIFLFKVLKLLRCYNGKFIKIDDYFEYE